MAVGDSSAISVVITGLTNPAAGTYANTSFSVSTSADTAASNPPVAILLGGLGEYHYRPRAVFGLGRLRL